MKEVVRALSLLGLRELVAEFGGDLDALAREAGLELDDLNEPEKLIPARKAHELVNFAAARLGRKDLGLLWGARSDPSRLGPLYVAVANAQTGRQALELVANFLHVNFPTGSVFLKKLPGRPHDFLGVRSYLRNPPPLAHFHERRVGSLHVVLKLVCGPGYGPHQVWFSHEQLSSMPAYQRVFGVRPLFGMKENGLVIARSVLDAVRPSANRQVREMAVAYLKAHAPAADASITAETRYVTEVLMRSSLCTVTEAARVLGLHQRSLQRRLRDEGTSFEEVRDGVRRDMARALLADPSLPITDIGLQLHYANASAFSRSCQRWFGRSPSAERERQLRASRRPDQAKTRSTSLFGTGH